MKVFTQRNPLPNTRRGKTVKFNLFDENGDTVDVYFTVNIYNDGYPGELWVWVGKEGDKVHGFVNSWATAVSMLLQYGVDPEVIYDKFIGVRFEPQGPTGTDWAPICTSIVDCIMRYMKQNFPANKDNYEKIIDS